MADMSNRKTKKQAIILDGPIGVGKTTFGRSLAEKFSGKFLDGDDFSEPNTPWYASSLSTNRRIFEASIAALETTHIVFIGNPIRCVNWIFFSHRFQTAQIDTLFVGLHASFENIASEERSRQLTISEIERTKEMIEQGYGSRPFCDYFLQTDTGDVSEVTELAVTLLHQALSD